MNKDVTCNKGILTKKINGYNWIRINKIWIQEHRLVAENILHRLLNNDEVIHHINFIRDDNRPENLALFESVKAHSHWHRQYNQFNWTQPLRTIIEQRKICNLVVKPKI